MIPARISVIIGAMILGCLLAAQAQGAKGKLTPEDYVRQQAAKGEWADLDRFGKKEEDRRLSARFLEDILTGAYKVHRKGVWIKNAVITEALDLEEARIPQSVDLADCRFKDRVVFRDAVFEKHFIISGSHFEKAADFHRVTVKLNLFCRNATFEGPVDLRSGNIGGQFSADGAKFESTEHPADFNGLKVGHAFFGQAVFKGPVDFVSADIGGQFNANGARFDSPEHKADFSILKVGRDAFFDQAVFHGPVNFVSADIGGQFSAEGVKFEGTKHKADFNALKVGQGAFFDQGVFKGPVDFVGAEIKGVFVARSALFASPEHKASFNGLKVGQSAFFDNAAFQGPVDFISADIKGQFNANGAQFLSEKHPAVFEGMRVGLNALFWNVTCRSEVNLTYGTFLVLYLQGAGGEKQDEAGGQVRLNLTGTQIQRKLLVTNLELKSLEAGHLRVKGPATFEGLSIKEKADFQNAALETLEFKQVTWPVEQAKRKLDGLTYTSLCVDQPDNFPGLLGLVERSAFNPQNYGQLEDYCKRGGHKDWADKVFIHLKDRELEQRSWYNPGRWLIQIFWGWLAGYGRDPLRVFWLSLAIVLLGAVLFDPQRLEGYKRPPYTKPYTTKHWVSLLRVSLLRFLISLDQFLPAINMGLAEHWKAKDTRFSVWLYFTMEQCLGWVLIPIALAAIYTQIK